MSAGNIIFSAALFLPPIVISIWLYHSAKRKKAHVIPWVIVGLVIYAIGYFVSTKAIYPLTPLIFIQDEDMQILAVYLLSNIMGFVCVFLFIEIFLRRPVSYKALEKSHVALMLVAIKGPLQGQQFTV